jgi:hypothetical protein
MQYSSSASPSTWTGMDSDTRQLRPNVDPNVIETRNMWEAYSEEEKNKKAK